MAAESKKTDVGEGVTFGPLNRVITLTAVTYDLIEVELDHAGRKATITLKGPSEAAPSICPPFKHRATRPIY